MKSDNTLLLCPDVRRTYDTDWFLLSVRLNIKEFCVASQLKECVFMGDVNPLGAVIFQWFQKGLQEHNLKKCTAHAFEDLLADTKDDNTSYYHIQQQQQQSLLFLIFWSVRTGCLDCVVICHNFSTSIWTFHKNRTSKNIVQNWYDLWTTFNKSISMIGILCVNNNQIMHYKRIVHGCNS